MPMQFCLLSSLPSLYSCIVPNFFRYLWYFTYAVPSFLMLQTHLVKFPLSSSQVTAFPVPALILFFFPTKWLSLTSQTTSSSKSVLLGSNYIVMKVYLLSMLCVSLYYLGDFIDRVWYTGHSMDICQSYISTSVIPTISIYIQLLLQILSIVFETKISLWTLWFLVDSNTFYFTWN